MPLFIWLQPVHLSGEGFVSIAIVPTYQESVVVTTGFFNDQHTVLKCDVKPAEIGGVAYRVIGAECRD